jgi:hypothetical protein
MTCAHHKRLVVVIELVSTRREDSEPVDGTVECPSDAESVLDLILTME